MYKEAILQYKDFKPNIDNYSVNSYHLGKYSKHINKKLIRNKELSDEEIKKQGHELLEKLLIKIPQYFNRIYSEKCGVVFNNNKQMIRISLAIRPLSVVQFVVEAFRVKGWDITHHFSDDKYQSYDFIELSLPNDWLSRILGIGKYHQ